MASTPFRAVSWAPSELIGEDKMDQLAYNVNYLRDHKVGGLYTLPGGARREEGVRIAAGRVRIGRSKDDSSSAGVRFGRFFSTGCEPIITTGIVAEGQRKIFCILNGYGRLQPDHRGFQVHVNVMADAKRNDKIASAFYISWQALGY